MNPKLIILNYFDSLVNRIDIHTEEQLEKTKETDLIAIEKPFTYTESELDYYPFFSEYDLSNQPSRQIPTGSIKVLYYLNETRDKLIAEVNTAKDEAIKRCDDIRDELKLISKDVTKTKEQRDEEIKGKVFANKFLGLVQIDQIGIEDYELRENESPFKLYLVELDYYMGQDEQFLFGQMNKFLVGNLFFGKMIPLSNEPESTDNRQYSLDKIALRANSLGKYLVGIINHQGFLHFMRIREVDLFCIDNVFIKNIQCFKHIDLGNSENSFLSIKSLTLKDFDSFIGDKRIEVKDLSSLVNLRSLTLNTGSLYDSSFQGHTRLESLELIDCDFKNFKSNSFRYVPNLEVLEIDTPKNLIDIPCIKELSKLNKLDLHLVESLDIFEYLKNDNLETLIFQFKEDLNYFDGKCLSGFPKLNSLTLASTSENCKIKSINLNYDFLSRLENLSLSRFLFTSFDILSLPEFLNLKHFSFCWCTTGSKINHADLFKKLGKLYSLKIMKSSEFFKEIPSTVFDDLENLTHLNLRFNNLTEINPEWFIRMPNLKTLDLSSNKTNLLPKEMFSHLTNLTSLRLSFNHFNQLNDGVFSHLSNLEKLDISHNYNLQELKPQVFDGLDKLIELNIKYMNRDFQLDVDLFTLLPSLKNVKLTYRFENMQPQLSEKYGSEIKFKFE